MGKLLIFDCDGTLVDTLHDVALCFNRALEENGFPPHPLNAYSSFVGGNLEQIITRLLPEGQVTSENVDRVKSEYRSLYQSSKKENTVLYKGIRRAVDALREQGNTIAVNTNKGQVLAEELLDSLFPDHPFDCIVGYEETRPSKPDPYGVHMICTKLGYQASEAVYIGDGQSDLLTAKNAGIPFVLVEWGQGGSMLMDSGDVASVVKNPADLVAAIEGICGGN